MTDSEKQIDTEYYCENCFDDRDKLVKYKFLPRTTIHYNLVVKICPHCDGSELFRLANREEDDGE